MKMSVYLHRRKRGLASECSRILGIFDEKNTHNPMRGREC